ncbi:MAG: rhodanese-like domain-containing protein [Chloroflexi bacterium]|nr:rhodanese-like domain-containing protein [Chloroflexota bacterium]
MRTIFLFLLVAMLALAACGTPALNAPTKVNVADGSYTNVAPALLKQMLATKDFVLVNVHIPYAGEIEKTDAFIPYDEIQPNISKFPADKNAKILLYCQSGRMSTIAAEELVKLGYTNLWHLDGGMSAWENAGLPVIRK